MKQNIANNNPLCYDVKYSSFMFFILQSSLLVSFAVRKWYQYIYIKKIHLHTTDQRVMFTYTDWYRILTEEYNTLECHHL